MSSEAPKNESALRNPQVIAAIIGAFTTLAVAIITILPNLVNRPVSATATPVVIVATPTSEATPIPPVPTTEPTLIPSVTALPLMATIEATPAVQLTALEPSVAEAPNARLFFDEVSFTLLSLAGSPLALEGVTFRSAVGQWDAVQWGTSLYNNVPGGMCLRIRDFNAGQRQPPAPCVDRIYGLMTPSGSALFWIGAEQFEVIHNGMVIQTCTVATTTCDVQIPQP